MAGYSPILYRNKLKILIILKLTLNEEGVLHIYACEWSL